MSLYVRVHLICFFSILPFCFSYSNTAQWFVCVSVSLLLLIYHLLSTQEMCEKRLNEKKKRHREKEWRNTYKHRKETRKREKANSIIVVTIVMALLTCLSIHIQVLVRGGMYIYISKTAILSNVVINLLVITYVNLTFDQGFI